MHYARLTEEAGADTVETESCPHGLHQMTGEELKEAMWAVRQSIQQPIIPKLLPQNMIPLRTVLDLEPAGAGGVTMFNRFSGLEIDADTELPVTVDPGLHSTAWARLLLPSIISLSPSPALAAYGGEAIL